MKVANMNMYYCEYTAIISNSNIKKYDKDDHKNKC